MSLNWFTSLQYSTNAVEDADEEEENNNAWIAYNIEKDISSLKEEVITYLFCTLKKLIRIYFVLDWEIRWQGWSRKTFYTKGANTE